MINPSSDDSIHYTCTLLGELLASAVTTEHVSENKPDIPRLSAALHAYAQSLPTDRHLVPLPNNGQLMLEWLEGVAAGQGRRLYLLPSSEFAERYPTRAILVPRSLPITDATLIAARA